MRRRDGGWLAVLLVLTTLRVPVSARAEEPPAFPAQSPAPTRAPTAPPYRDLLPFGLRGRGTPQPAWLEAGLGFLRSQQRPTGGWKAGAGYEVFDLGVTALAALAFLAAGVSPEESDESGKALAAAIALLRKEQDAEGCVGARTNNHFVYGHAFATLALVEAFAATGDPTLRTAAQKALDFIAICRNPYFAWRYGVKPGDNDTSVTGCMLAALHAARLVNRAAIAAGLAPAFTYDEEAFDGVKAWIDKMTDWDDGSVGYEMRGRFSPGSRLDEQAATRFPLEKSETMTAIGVFARGVLGGTPDSVQYGRRGATRLAARAPLWDTSGGSMDLYGWWWGTQAMRTVGGKEWVAWRSALEGALRPSQATKDGSWPAIDAWGRAGGPVYSTSMAISCLLVERRIEADPECRMSNLQSAQPDRSPELRATALRALSLRPVAGATPTAVAAMNAAELDVRRAALGVLLRSATSAQGQALIGAVTDPDEVVASSAALALGRLRFAPAAPALTRAISSPSLSLRCSALWALGEIGPPAVASLPTVTEALSFAAPIEQVEAARALWLLRGEVPPNLDDVARHVASEDGFLRVRALAVLATIGAASPPTADVARAALASSDTETSIAASEALRALGREARSARLALEETAFSGATPGIRTAASQALAELDGAASRATAAPDGPSARLRLPLPVDSKSLALLLRDPAKAAALRASLRSPKALPLLLPLLDDPEEGVRIRTMEAIGDLGSAAAETWVRLVAVAAGGSPQAAAAALRALARISPESVPVKEALLKGLSAASADVRAAALEGISRSKLPPEGVLPLLRSFVGRDGPPQVLKALQASVRWGADEGQLRGFLPPLQSRPDLVLGALLSVRPLSTAAVPLVLSIAEQHAPALSNEAFVAARDALCEIGKKDAAARGAIVAFWRTHPGPLCAHVLSAIGRPVAVEVAKGLMEGSPELQTHAAYVLALLEKEAVPAIATIAASLRTTWPDGVYRQLGGVFADTLGASGRSALVAALASPLPEIRGGAAMLMERIGSQHGRVPELRAALERAMAREKVEAVRARMSLALKANGP